MKNVDFQQERYRKQVQQDPGNPHWHLCLGLVCELLEEDAEALREYEQAVKLDPDEPKYLLPLGLLYTRLGRCDLAMQAFSKACSADPPLSQRLKTHPFDGAIPSLDFGRWIEAGVEAYRTRLGRNPDDLQAHLDLATVLLLIGRVQESLGVLQRAQEISPGTPNIYHLQSIAYRQNALPELAAKSLEQLVALQPENVEGWVLLGQASFQLERYALSQKHFEKAVGLDPKQIKALLGLGQVLAQLGRRDLAVQQFTKVVELTPKHPEAHFQLARLSEEKFDLQTAARHYKTAIELAPSNAEAHHGLGRVSDRMGLPQEAVQAFTKAVDLSPHDPELRDHLGQAYVHMGEHAKAVEQFIEAIRFNPGDAYLHHHLGNTYEKLGNREGALGAFRKAIELNPDDAYAHYHLGLVYLADEQLSLAAGEFERVLEITPNDAFAYYNLGAAYARLGFLDKGIEAYQRATTLHPSSAYAHFNLGAAYAREGEPALAEEEFKKATALTPKNEEELALFATLNSQAFINIEMAKLNQQLKELYTKTVEALILTLDAKDHYTAGHTSRVSSLSQKIGRQMGLTKEEMESIRMGALLHDIGKIGIPEQILLKKDRLTAEEFETMKAHPTIGFKILKPVKFPWKGVADIVRHHHEKVDGSGYPDGLVGDAIPIGAQIIGLADFFDALATERPYKPALPIPVVMEEIEKLTGRSFHPEVVEGLKRSLDESVERLYSNQQARGRMATQEEIELWNVLS